MNDRPRPTSGEDGSAMAEPTDRGTHAEDTTGAVRLATEQLRGLVEDAERTAATLEAAAEEERAELRRRAEREAHAIAGRAQAEAEARATTASDALAALQVRVGAVETQAQEVQEIFRSVTETLVGDLGKTIEAVTSALRHRVTVLESEIELIQAVADPQAATTVPEADPLTGEEAVEAVVVLEDARGGGAPADSSASPTMSPVTEVSPDENDPPRGARQGDEPPAVSAPAATPATKDGDVERARLVALNMALRGTGRDEAERHLAAHFAIEDVASVLGEAYASADEASR